MANLAQLMDPKDLDAIVITHEHPDHCCDLTAYDVYMAKGTGEPTEMPIYAAPGVREQIFPRSEPFSLIWTELQDSDELEIGDFTIRTARTDHGPMTLGLRIESCGRVLGYTADTGPAWDMSTLGADLDIALCDAVSTSDSTAPGHCNATEAARLASNTGAQRLMLTHIRSGFDKDLMKKEAEAVFAGEVLIAKAGETYTI
jgi:ribonuclease BN (tRNA processing enzyme)